MDSPGVIARILLAFVAFVAAMVAFSGLKDGDAGTWVPALAVLAGAGALLLRNLRNPEISRKGGLRGQVTFQLEQGRGMARKGTFARVKTHDGNWDVTLDRVPERGDMDIYGTAHRGWVWLDQSGLPEKVRIDYGSTWKSWPVLEAAMTAATQDKAR